MSFLTKTENTTASLASRINKIAGNLSVAIKSANALASELLALSNEDLCEWLNSKPLEKRMEEFASHGLIGQRLNDVAEQLEKFSQMPLGRVDTRPFPEKLASYRRELTIVENGFLITDYPVLEAEPKLTQESEPEPEFTPEPEPETEPSPEPIPES
jgi:hypothetical protein